MVATIKQTVTVQADGVLELRDPKLRSGQRAEVVVTVKDAEPEAQPERPLSSFFGAAEGPHRSIEEIDAYIRELRDEWDR